MTMLPKYFYSFDAITDEGRPRWYDDLKPEDKPVITIEDLRRSRFKDIRDAAYAAWQRSIGIDSPRQSIFQAVRVINFKPKLSSKEDWWENYQDAVFRVFVNPVQVYVGKECFQYYLLCPEDAYLVNRYELMKTNPELAPRDYAGFEKLLSKHKVLRTGRLIPIECCKHYRHETVAGELPQGL